MWRHALAAAIVLTVLLSCGQEARRPEPKPVAGLQKETKAPPVKKAIPEATFAYEIMEHNTPLEMMADSTTLVLVKIKNTSTRPWALGGDIRLGFAWSNSAGQELEGMVGRALPQKDVPPGQMAYFKARVKAPKTLGTYYLTWDMVEEKVAWFGKRGATPIKVAVTVK